MICFISPGKIPRLSTFCHNHQTACLNIIKTANKAAIVHYPHRFIFCNRFCRATYFLDQMDNTLQDLCKILYCIGSFVLQTPVASAPVFPFYYFFTPYSVHNPLFLRLGHWSQVCGLFWGHLCGPDLWKSPPLSMNLTAWCQF